MGLISYLRRRNYKTKAMIEYAKVMLPQVSYDPALFRKELIKCISWIEKPAEFNELLKWCVNNFKDVHSSIIDEVFSTTAA